MAAPNTAIEAAKATYGLTDRELEYLVLVLRRKEPTVHHMAEHMGCSANTVEVHRRKLYKKLAVHSRLELYYKAVVLGLVPCACHTMGTAGAAQVPAAH